MAARFPKPDLPEGRCSVCYTWTEACVTCKCRAVGEKYSDIVTRGISLADEAHQYHYPRGYQSDCWNCTSGRCDYHGVSRASVGGPPGYAVGIDFAKNDGSSMVVYSTGRKWGKTSAAIASLIEQMRRYGLTIDEQQLSVNHKRAMVELMYGKLDPYSPMAAYAEADANATMAMWPAATPTVPYPPTQYEGEPMHRLDVVEAEIRRLQRERAILARFPKDTFEDCTVLKFEKVFGSWEDTIDSDVMPKFTYAAIKADGLWYLTGPQACNKKYKWYELTEWMGDGVNAVYVMEPARNILSTTDDAGEATDVGLEEKHGATDDDHPVGLSE